MKRKDWNRQAGTGGEHTPYPAVPLEGVPQLGVDLLLVEVVDGEVKVLAPAAGHAHGGRLAGVVGDADLPLAAEPGRLLVLHRLPRAPRRRRQQLLPLPSHPCLFPSPLAPGAVVGWFRMGFGFELLWLWRREEDEGKVMGWMRIVGFMSWILKVKPRLDLTCVWAGNKEVVPELGPKQIK
jgi:hypothetical protein